MKLLTNKRYSGTPTFWQRIFYVKLLGYRRRRATKQDMVLRGFDALCCNCRQDTDYQIMSKRAGKVANYIGIVWNDDSTTTTGTRKKKQVKKGK